MPRATPYRRFRRRLRGVGRTLRRALAPPRYARELERIARLEDTVARLLARDHRAAWPQRSQRDWLAACELGITSQNGEDGILLALFSEVGVADGFAVEFGIQDGRECNSAHLILRCGWDGLLMDADPQGIEAARRFYHDERGISPLRLSIEERWITAENVHQWVSGAHTPADIDLLSIDVDGNDYWIWKAIPDARARVVVIEYNASFGPADSLTIPYSESFARSETDPRSPDAWYHGASLAALAALGRHKGYALVGCDSSGVNAFFVRGDLLAGRLAAMEPERAYYPDARRLSFASLDEQRAALLDRPLVKAPDPAA